MCGIAGLILFKKPTKWNVQEVLVQMAQDIKHRGPDDEGFLLASENDEVEVFAGADTSAKAKNMFGLKHIKESNSEGIKVAFAHRRLSIIDTSANGYQPMSYDNGRYWIVYNGEIYNYQELRTQLLELGYQFYSNSDTEVLLACYKEYGEHCVNKLNGMWAFAIYDKVSGEVFASRDRFGIKPLYYLEHEEGISFASEIKALANLPYYQKKINRRASFDYLVNGVLEREPNSLFDKITELPPSTNFAYSFSDKLFRTWNYYFLTYKPEFSTFDEERLTTYSKKIRRMLRKNIVSHLQSDVQIGTSLSGGLDSSTIASLVQLELKENGPIAAIGTNQKLFTVVFPGTPADESEWAKQVVDATNAEWYRVEPNAKGFMDNLETVIKLHDIPFLGVNTYSQFALMEEMRKQGIRVTLDGQGADEMFGGYANYFVTFMRDMAANGSYGNWLFNFISANSSFGSKGMLIREYMKMVYSNIVARSSGSRIRKGDVPEYEYLRDEFWDRYHKKLLAPIAPKILNAHLHADFTGPTMKTLLRNTDRNSMHFGIEARTPFADDHELAEYVFKIGGIYKIRYAMGKLLLRKAIGNTLPEKILFRKDKMGFTAPQEKWMHDSRKELFDFIGPHIKDVIDYKNLSNNWEKVMRNPSPKMWRIINYAAWRYLYKL